MPDWSETVYNYMTFGECLCATSVKANLALLNLSFFGQARFDEEWEDTLTRYLRVDRTLTSVTPPYTFPSGWYNYYTGWWTENRFTGLETKSHPSFNEPWNWVESIKYNKTQTTRDIIFPQTAYDDDGFPYDVVVNLRETATIPWTAYDKDERLREDIVDAIPWDNPFIFDLEHWLLAYFTYDNDGNVILNSLADPNPTIFGFPCVNGFSVSSQVIGPGYSGYPGILGMRRKYNTSFRHRLGGSPPFFACGTPPGSPFSPIYVASALSIITPPTNDQMLAAGGTPSQWGHSSMLVCE